MVRILKYYKRRFAIKLHGIGCVNRPFFQIGVAPSMKRAGRILDEVFGSYDPMPNERNEKLIAIDLDRLAYWLGKGAVPDREMKRLLGLIGFFPMCPPIYKEAWDNRLKAITSPDSTNETNKDSSNEAVSN